MSMQKPWFLRLALPTPLRRYFDYLPPKNIEPDQLQLGMRIKVPFGKRTLVGILIQLHHQSEIPLEKLKPAYQVLESEPLLTPELLKLGLWLVDYYHHAPGDIFLSLLPTLLRQVEELKTNQRQSQQCYRLTQVGESQIAETSSSLTQKQRDILLWLQQNADVSSKAIQHAQLSMNIVKRLQKQGYIETITLQTSVVIETPPTLMPEQEVVMKQIKDDLNKFATWVLDGITGSGKTEIYLQLIRLVLNEQKQVLVLIPEIGLTPQMVSRFQQRFKEPIVVIHSGLSPKERLAAWLDARHHKACIVLGTRSALFTPFSDLGLIIVDEAHDSSFKQQDHLRYHARDVAIKRAQLLNIPIVLGSATHSLETLYAVKQRRFRYTRLTTRAGLAQLPSISLLSIRDTRLHEGLAPKLIDAMGKHLAAGNQVLLFLNRRGFAPSLMCHQCAWIAHCKHCDAKLTLHLDPRQLRCHHCDRIYPEPKSCLSCHGRQLIPLGLGTVRIEQALADIFPHHPSIRIDRDSIRGKALETAISHIHQGKAHILIGTQMLAKGHHFPNVTLVGIVDGDSGFFSSDFRGAERMAQTLLQVAGRAGRAQKPGEVIIQTRHPEHPLLQALVNEGYHAFVKMTLTEREQAALPPFHSLALIRAEGTQEAPLHDFLNQLKAIGIKINRHAIDMLGPIPAPMTRKAGKLQFQLLLSSPKRSALQQFLHDLLAEIEQLPSAKRIRWSLDVDPIDMC